MLLDKINKVTESMLSFYKKLIELESAFIAFDLNLVHSRINEIAVIKVGLNKSISELKQTFMKDVKLTYSEKIFSDYCKNDTNLNIAYDNLISYMQACRNQWAEIDNLQNEARKISHKFFGGEISTALQKNSKWNQRSRR